MQFEMGFAFRGTNSPEVKQVVEASSMREAMLNIIDQHGGDEVVLVTHAHYLQVPEPPQLVAECGPCGGVEPFMLAALCRA
jgi:hypothetical protein